MRSPRACHHAEENGDLDHVGRHAVRASHDQSNALTAVYPPSPLVRFRRSWRDGREAEGTGLLNRHRGSTSIEGSNPSLSVSKARRSRRRAFVLHPARYAGSCPPPIASPPLRPVADRLSARRRRAHRALQLALRTQVRRPVPAPHRGHRQGAQHRREHARDLRGARVARPRRGTRRSSIRARTSSAIAPTRSACSTTARPTAASARTAELDGAARGRRGEQARPSSTTAAATDSRADEVARRVAAGDAVRRPLPRARRARRRGTTSSTDDITFPNKDIEDFIILRSDGTPIYNLAVVSRRHRDGASRSSCAATITSRTRRSRSCSIDALGAALPRFAHLPMIHGLGRQEAQQAPRRDRGRRLPAPRASCRGAMLNFLALLGWSPGNDIEVMTHRRR